jgi:hypothetical protein
MKDVVKLGVISKSCRTLVDTARQKCKRANHLRMLVRRFHFLQVAAGPSVFFRLSLLARRIS